MDAILEGNEKALPVLPKREGDKLVADIPNILLQSDLEDECDIKLNIYMVKNDVTICHRQFTVRHREKPDDYVYKETEVKTYEELDERLTDVEEKCEQFADQEELEDVRKTAETAEQIAKGKAKGHVFDTVAELDLWLQDENNVKILNRGDNLYIIDTAVPDYWWDGAKKQELETQKVDLSGYPKKDEVPSKRSELENDAGFLKKDTLPSDIFITEYKVTRFKEIDDAFKLAKNIILKVTYQENGTEIFATLNKCNDDVSEKRYEFHRIRKASSEVSRSCNYYIDEQDRWWTDSTELVSKEHFAQALTDYVKNTDYATHTKGV